MGQSAYTLAVREGFESIETGTPFFISSKVYESACALSFSPRLPTITSSTLSPIFEASSRSALSHLSWAVLIHPILDLAATLGRDIYANPARLASSTWHSITWGILDRMMEHIDHITYLIVSDSSRVFKLC